MPSAPRPAALIATMFLLHSGCGSSGAPPSAPDPVTAAATPQVAADPPPVVDVSPPAPPAATVDERPAAEPLRADRGALLPRLASARRVTASIVTDFGVLDCDLFQDRAPRTVENFVGLATGEKEWKDPRTGRRTHEPAYDGSSFHRVIPGFMIQGGDPKGDGSGEPGFVIDDEIWPGAKHDRAGLLCMANRGKNTNGAQFFITDAATPHLDGGYTIFGECRPLDVVHRIATEPRGAADRPNRRIGIQRVTIELDGAR